MEVRFHQLRWEYQRLTQIALLVHIHTWHSVEVSLTILFVRSFVCYCGEFIKNNMSTKEDRYHSIRIFDMLLLTVVSISFGSNTSVDWTNKPTAKMSSTTVVQCYYLNIVRKME
jgi:hypothetical protein